MRSVPLVAAGIAAAASLAAAEPSQLECDALVAGAGWSGVYAAYRLAEQWAGEAQRTICIAERSSRVGGRTFSKRFAPRGESFVLDLGAYRFSPDMHLPGDLMRAAGPIGNATRLQCYEPSCPPADRDFPQPLHFPYSSPLQRLVDAEGMPCGYGEAIERLLEAAGRLGPRLALHLETTVEDVRRTEAGARVVLRERSGRVLQTDVRFAALNLPRTALWQLPAYREQLAERTQRALRCVAFELPPAFEKFHVQPGRHLSKAYVYYHDAWWLNALQRGEGMYPEGAMLAPVRTKAGPVVGIHFNDGPVRCEQRSPYKGCRGYLQVFYSFVKGQQFYTHLANTSVSAEGETSAAPDMEVLHRALMEVVAPLFEAARLPAATSLPEHLAVGVWTRELDDPLALTAPSKVYYARTSGSSPAKACALDGLDEAEYRRLALHPWAAPQVFVANNDFICQATEDTWGDWAEESLLQAERGLRAWGFPPPKWLDADYYDRRVVRELPPAAPAQVSLVV